MQQDPKCKIVIISGRPATGKTTICDLLKEQLTLDDSDHQIIFLDSNTLLNNSEYTQEHSEMIKDLRNRGKLKYDLDPTIMASILNRFFETHNSPKNIILFYRGPQRREVCENLSFTPSIYLYLDAPSEDLIDRVCLRRVDLLTRKTLHLKNDAQYIEENKKVLKLSQRIGDSIELFKPRLERSDKYLLPVLEYYKTMNKSMIVTCEKGKSKEMVFEEVYNIVKTILTG